MESLSKAKEFMFSFAYDLAISNCMSLYPPFECMSGTINPSHLSRRPMENVLTKWVCTFLQDFVACKRKRNNNGCVPLCTCFTSSVSQSLQS